MTNKTSLYDKIVQATDFISQKISKIPVFGIVAGTGLSSIGDDIENPTEIAYADIPHFPQPTVTNHQGTMVFGKLGDQQVCVLKGRFHYYEGYSMEEVTFYVRVLHHLGIKKLIISNASGALQADIHAGDLVLIEDHINMQGVNPLRGIHDERLGLRFPAMNRVYSKSLLKKAKKAAQKKKYPHRVGVYVGVQGPSLETPAEYTCFGKMGGDVVGMSTVPEVIVAAQCNMKVLCISLCTNNPFFGDAATSIEEVLEVAQQAESKVRYIVRKVVNA